MTRSTRLKQTCAIFVFCLAIVAGATAQTFTTLVNFDGTNGEMPYLSSLIQGTDGNLYGATFEGGVSANCQALGIAFGCGTIFKMTPNGTLTTIYNFCELSGCTDGYSPNQIALGSDGNFYGTTYAGGAHLGGTIFSVTPVGTLTTLYNFCSQANCADGAYVISGLMQATDGNWYGTTFGGGNSGCENYGCGTVFKMTPAGTLTTIYAFPSSGNPASALIQGRDGNLYGTETGNGGGGGGSAIFRITLAGAFTKLYQFESAADVYSGLVQGLDGNFYGTSAAGGSNTSGDCANGYTCGTVFKMTPSGTLTTIYNFCSQSNCADGAVPFSTLIQATDGKFYGMTNSGGSLQAGVVFSISSAGAMSTLESFDGKNGAAPYNGFLQHTSGVFYGMTTSGGVSENYGDIFRMKNHLRPFAAFVRGYGKAGTAVQILGQGFTGTTAVSFDGTPAAFVVDGDTFLTATVPSGAKTGFVSVITPNGTLTSNRQFIVKP